MALEIKDWQECFECAHSRKVKGPLSWFSFPIDHSSSGYIELMSRGSEGVAAYGVFASLLALAGSRKKEHRGRLVKNDGKAMTVKSIAVHIRLPHPIVVAAIDLLKTNEIGWIVDRDTEGVPLRQDGIPLHRDAVPPRDHNVPDTVQNSTEHDTTEHDTTRQGESLVPDSLRTPEFMDAWERYQLWILDRDGKFESDITLKLRLKADLLPAGPEKAVKDLELTMKSAKHTGKIWDSSRDQNNKPKSFYKELVPPGGIA